MKLALETSAETVLNAGNTYKALGDSAIAAIVATSLATIVVMLMTTPRNTREWAVGLISTIVSSVSGGAALIQYLGVQIWANSTGGLLAMGGLIFACGLPGWAIVRAVFRYIDSKQDATIVQIAKDIKAAL